MVASRPALLTTLTLADGLQSSLQLPCKYGWTELQFRLNATSANGPPASVLLDEELNLISNIALNVQGVELFSISPAVFYKMSTYLKRTAGNRVAATTTPGAMNWGFSVPLSLPYPANNPAAHGTLLPAGLCNSIELKVTCPAGLIAAVFGTPGTTSFSVGPVLTVQAMQLDMEVDQLKRHVSLMGHACRIQQLSKTISAAGDLDQDLPGSNGLVKWIGFAAVNNSLYSNAIVTNQKLILGTNDNVIDSTFLLMMDKAKELFQIETNPTGVWLANMAPNGRFFEGVELAGQNTVKLRSTCIAPTGTAREHTVIATLDREFYKRLVRV